MPAYWLSFRVHSGFAGYKTYSQRRKGMLDALEKECTKKYEPWDDTTSFIIFEASSTDCVAIAKRLSASLDREHDMLLLRAMNSRNAAAFGVKHKRELRGYMTYGGECYLEDITPPAR